MLTLIINILTTEHSTPAVSVSDYCVLVSGEPEQV